MQLSKLVADLIRGLSDEDICRLVGEKIIEERPGGAGGFAHTAEENRSAEATAPSNSQPKNKTTKRRAAKKKGGGRGARVDYTLMSKNIRRFVRQRKGTSVSQVAEKFSLPKPKAASLLKKLVDEKEIAKGGDRRFCRYAADTKTAKNASLAARGK